MDVTLYANTSGRGLWTGTIREMLVTELRLESAYIDPEEKTSAVYVRAIFDRKTWGRIDGLVYTDPKWIREFRLGLIDLGLDPALAKRVDYTEQGMQGNNYVSVCFYGKAKDANAFLSFINS